MLGLTRSGLVQLRLTSLESVVPVRAHRGGAVGGVHRCIQRCANIRHQFEDF